MHSDDEIESLFPKIEAAPIQPNKIGEPTTRPGRKIKKLAAELPVSVVGRRIQ